MQRFFSEWMYAMKQYYLKNGGETNEATKTRPYKNVSLANWAKLCDHWSSDSQQAISRRNKANRAKMSMLEGHGSKSFLAYFREIATKSGQPPSNIDTFEQLHRKQDGWPSEEVEKAHTSITKHTCCLV